MTLGRGPRQATVQQPDCHRRQDRDHDQYDDERHTRPPGAIEEGPFGGRLDPWLGGRVAAAIADQRLVGDFGSTM